MTTLQFIQDYAGLAIGLVFLLLAVSVLPGRIKWYVLTAGLAIIGYEAYMRTRNRKLMAEADAEREELRKRVKKLDQRKAELEKSVTELNKEAAALRENQVQLEKKKNDLEQEGGDIAARKKALDDETKVLLDKSEAVSSQLDGGEAVLQMLLEAEHSLDETNEPANQ